MNKIEIKIKWRGLSDSQIESMVLEQLRDIVREMCDGESPEEVRSADPPVGPLNSAGEATADTNSGLRTRCCDRED